MPNLTHIDETGSAAMVDISEKAPSARVARARASVRVAGATLEAVRAADHPKGDVRAVARIAGIQAAKRVDELIPLAHSIPLTQVTVDIALEEPASAEARPSGAIVVVCEARTVAATGVEMEALTGACVAALTVYDMVKSIDRSASIERVELLAKSGGRSGDWQRE